MLTIMTRKSPYDQFGVAYITRGTINVVLDNLSELYPFRQYSCAIDGDSIIVKQMHEGLTDRTIELRDGHYLVSDCWGNISASHRHGIETYYTQSVEV